MALDRLAPDQRAVVQLVLQQERSYDELADLLGISTDAVRERARRGLERLEPGTGLDESQRGEITDYLLGQQSVSGRERTRALLNDNNEARSWAQAVAPDLETVARTALPEIPEGPHEVSGPHYPDPTPEDEVRPHRARGGLPAASSAAAAQAGDVEPVAGPAVEAAGEDASEDTDEAPVRARPRPRPGAADRERERKPRGAATKGERPRSSLIGGALLIAGLALVVVVLVVWLVSGGNDDEGGGNGGAATPTATATPTVQPAGQIRLRPPGGEGDATGAMTLYIQGEQVAFTVEATGLPQSREGEAYAIWLTGGDRPRRLGFAPPVGEDGQLGTSGPREGDAQRFAQWFADARNVVVSRETTQDSTEPGTVVLRGSIPRGNAGG